ncbi:hypothetical protein [Streptomyces laurentii]|uniref:hypothetical protein n=1 Tax=Streptomyces laurentii TaxID=39478 RepID=UPI0036755228
MATPVAVVAKKAVAKKAAAKKTAAKKAAPAKKAAAGAPPVSKGPAKKRATSGSQTQPSGSTPQPNAPAAAAPAAGQEPPAPAELPIPEALKRGNGGAMDTGAGIVLGVVGYALLVNFLRGGPSQVKTWLAAKFVNKPATKVGKKSDKPVGPRPRVGKHTRGVN